MAVSLFSMSSLASPWAVAELGAVRQQQIHTDMQMQFLAEIVSLQTDTAEQLMPLVNRLVLGLIVSATIIGVSRMVSAYLSRKP